MVFVDEAYAITPWSEGKPEGYGSEAVSAMVEFMTRYKGLLHHRRRLRARDAALLPPHQPRAHAPISLPLRPRAPLAVGSHRRVQTDAARRAGAASAFGTGAASGLDDYFTAEAWQYLKGIIEVATRGVEIHLESEYDQATRTNYSDVFKFKPEFLLFTLFENQAGSMTNWPKRPSPSSSPKPSERPHTHSRAEAPRPRARRSLPTNPSR